MAKIIIIQPKTISEADYIALLEQYDFFFEKNIKEYLHEVANLIRRNQNENNKN